MPTAAKFFTRSEQEMLVRSIEEAERHTSGEIRLHLESLCLGNEIKAAKRVFTGLKMHKTAEHNGVLIYIATMSHKIAVIGDKGIHEKLGTAFWEELVQKLISRFREGRKAEALAECIIECGRQLGKYFPRTSDDADELTNNISFKR
jgi:uncharacterized membrane protein